MPAPTLYNLPQPQTGTGNFVRATSPTLVTPILGDASATSLTLGSGAILTAPSAAKLQLGAADAATPVAQTLQAQSVVAGTTNTAGANFIIAASKGTGTGGSGSIIFQVTQPGSTGSAQNALTTVMTISSDKLVTTTSSVSVGGSVLAAGGVFTASTSQIGSAGRGYFTYPADGILTANNAAATDFGRLQLGGTTASFPALKRSTTAIQARLADDSAFTNIQGKLQTDAAATTGLTAGVLAAITNASITITDSTGQVYRVPCII